MTATRSAAILAVLAGLAWVLVGCGSPAPSTGGSDAGASRVTAPSAVAVPDLPVTVTSADGKEVVVDDVSRIVPLWTSISEVVYGLGLGPNVVGRDVSTTFSPADQVPVVTRGHDLSAEALLSLKPTLVLADDESGPPEALDQIRAAGIPVVTFARANDVDDVAADIRAIAHAVGLDGQGQRLAEHTTAEIEQVQRAIPSDVEAPKVAFLYMRGNAGVYLLGGKGSGADSMIEAAGGIDAGTASGLDRPFTPITSEALVSAAPDVIAMTTSGLDSVGGLDGLLQIPGIAQTPAAGSRRVVTLDDGALYSFGARTPDALRVLIDDLYPEAGS
jgi:iron complex transport system substrate-binding protein